MKRVLCLLLVFVAFDCFAASFFYPYYGVLFECKIKSGKAIIVGYDSKAQKVVIPSEVKDKKGRKYPVTTVDLYSEWKYKTEVVVLEQGISVVGESCFRNFIKMNEIFIPNSIIKIGRNAFKSKTNSSIVFNMPSTINKVDLIAGNEILFYIENSVADLGNNSTSISEYPNETTLNSIVEETYKDESVALSVNSDIDLNIPSGKDKRDNTFCVIIANEKYSQKDTPGVKYAQQDGKTFQKYCQNTLGLPSKNIRIANNASYLQMKNLFAWFKQIGEVYGEDAKFIVYYIGHGVPDEKGNCKLIPSDVSINDIENGFGLKELYETLGTLTSNNVLVLIDACFSGNDRDDVAMLDGTHHGVVRKLKQETVSGNVVVLTASSDTETALSYDEKCHGLFSYYLMKKLQETKGDVTFGELYDYVKDRVMKTSVVDKGKKQTPSVFYSDKLVETWRNIKF